ncbi:copia protein [Tanacetum coccineum]
MSLSAGGSWLLFGGAFVVLCGLVGVGGCLDVFIWLGIMFVCGVMWVVEWIVGLFGVVCGAGLGGCGMGESWWFDVDGWYCWGIGGGIVVYIGSGCWSFGFGEWVVYVLCWGVFGMRLGGRLWRCVGHDDGEVGGVKHYFLGNYFGWYYSPMRCLIDANPRVVLLLLHNGGCITIVFVVDEVCDGEGKIGHFGIDNTWIYPPLPTQATSSAGNALGHGKSSYANVTGKPNEKKLNICTFLHRGSMDGLDAMLENGPWFIWNNPFIMKKWHPDENLLKEDVSTIPFWVKLHGVPITAFSDNGLSAIATKLGTLLMLDSYTSDILMCCRVGSIY